MSSVNKTENLNLCQFANTDVPGWVSDYSGDMLKIDTAFGGLTPIDTLSGIMSNVTNGKQAGAVGVKQGVQAMEDISADAWDNAVTYSAGEMCIHKNKIWKATVQTSSEPSGSSSDWTQTNLGDEVSSINMRLANSTGSVALTSNVPSGSNIFNQHIKQIGNIVIGSLSINTQGMSMSAFADVARVSGVSFPSATIPCSITALNTAARCNISADGTISVRALTPITDTYSIMFAYVV